MEAIIMMKASNIFSIIISELDHKNFDWIDEEFLKYSKFCWVTAFQLVNTIKYYKEILYLEPIKHSLLTASDIKEKHISNLLCVIMSLHLFGK